MEDKAKHKIAPSSAHSPEHKKENWFPAILLGAWLGTLFTIALTSQSIKSIAQALSVEWVTALATVGLLIVAHTTLRASNRRHDQTIGEIQKQNSVLKRQVTMQAERYERKNFKKYSKDVEFLKDNLNLKTAHEIDQTCDLLSKAIPHSKRVFLKQVTEYLKDLKDLHNMVKYIPERRAVWFRRYNEAYVMEIKIYLQNILESFINDERFPIEPDEIVPIDPRILSRFHMHKLSTLEACDADLYIYYAAFVRDEFIKTDY